MEVEIVKYDDLGRGIGYIDNKVIFVPKTVVGDIVLVDIINNKKNYLEGKINRVIKPSLKRINAICPYFNKCGGCDFLNISLNDSLDYKLDKINNLLNKNHINYSVKEIIKSDKEYYYRNKISLKIVNGEIGFYEYRSHNLIVVNKCFLVNENINNIISKIKLLNIKNGNITIRINYLDEMLIIIDSNDILNNIDEFINNTKVIGIIYNNKLIYGKDYFIDKINDYQFKVSYDAFFQVNSYICSKLFLLINEHTLNSHNIIDLYCGVGTLSLVASQNSDSVLGVEIIKNAILNANENAKLNNINNVKFICDDTKKIIDKITNKYDTIILDPPRSGVDKKVINKIIETKINKIIYISCDESTLMRDLKLLNEYYQIKEFKILDMFVNTEHLESFCVLTIKEERTIQNLN